MVSERNLRTALSAAALAVDTEEPLPNRALVTAVMTKPPIVVREETSIFDLARCFIHERIGALPVVDADTKIVGIVSYVDVLGSLIAPT
jgi:CBS domain-containing protein